MNYAHIRNNEIQDINICKYLDEDIQNIEVSDEILMAYNSDKNKIIYQDGQVVINPDYEAKQLTKAKVDKLAEISKKGEEYRYNQTFTLTIQNQECLFDTSSTTQSDLQTAVLEFLNGAETYNGWVTNNGIILNLTLVDVQSISAMFKELSNIYPKWLLYKEQVEKATTVDEVNAIVVDYSVDIPTEKTEG